MTLGDKARTALNHHINGNCKGCPYQNSADCRHDLTLDFLRFEYSLMSDEDKKRLHELGPTRNRIYEMISAQ